MSRKCGRRVMPHVALYDNYISSIPSTLRTSFSHSFTQASISWLSMTTIAEHSLCCGKKVVTTTFSITEHLIFGILLPFSLGITALYAPPNRLISIVSRMCLNEWHLPSQSVFPTFFSKSTPNAQGSSSHLQQFCRLWPNLINPAGFWWAAGVTSTFWHMAITEYSYNANNLPQLVCYIRIIASNFEVPCFVQHHVYLSITLGGSPDLLLKWRLCHPLIIFSSSERECVSKTVSSYDNASSSITSLLLETLLSQSADQTVKSHSLTKKIMRFIRHRLLVGHDYHRYDMTLVMHTLMNPLEVLIANFAFCQQTFDIVPPNFPLIWLANTGHFYVNLLVQEQICGCTLIESYLEPSHFFFQ